MDISNLCSFINLEVKRSKEEMDSHDLNNWCESCNLDTIRNHKDIPEVDNEPIVQCMPIDVMIFEIREIFVKDVEILRFSFLILRNILSYSTYIVKIQHPTYMQLITPHQLFYLLQCNVLDIQIFIKLKCQIISSNGFTNEQHCRPATAGLSSGGGKKITVQVFDT